MQPNKKKLNLKRNKPMVLLFKKNKFKKLRMNKMFKSNKNSNKKLLKNNKKRKELNLLLSQ